MTNDKRINRDIRSFCYYEKTASICVLMPEGGRAYVSEVEIGGLPPFRDPLDGATFDTIDEAHDAGTRFATSQADF